RPPGLLGQVVGRERLALSNGVEARPLAHFVLNSVDAQGDRVTRCGGCDLAVVDERDPGVLTAWDGLDSQVNDALEGRMDRTGIEEGGHLGEPRNHERPWLLDRTHILKYCPVLLVLSHATPSWARTTLTPATPIASSARRPSPA